MWTTVYITLIVIAVLMYLWMDGAKLLGDICGCVVFTLLIIYVLGIAVSCVLYLACLVVVGPFLRVLFRLDTANYMKVGLAWLMKPLNARWFGALVSAKKEKDA